MADAIEIVIWHLPGGSMGTDAQVVAQATLHEVEGGHGIYARVNGPRAWERRGFIAGQRREEIWRVVENAVAWAAAEAEKE